MSTDSFSAANTIIAGTSTITTLNWPTSSAPITTLPDVIVFTTGNGLGIARSNGSTEISTLGLTAARTFAVSNLSDTFVDTASVQTLTNKTVGGISNNVVAGVTFSGTPAVNKTPVMVTVATATWRYPGPMAVYPMNLATSSAVFVAVGGFIIYRNPTASAALNFVYANVTCAAGVTGTVRLFDTGTSLVVASASVSTASTFYTLTPSNVPTGTSPSLFVWQVQRTSGTVGNITTTTVTLLY